MKITKWLLASLGTLILSSSAAFSASALPVTAAPTDVPSTVSAMRIAGTVTGGLLTSSDPEFQQMVKEIQAGNYLGAAQVAVDSKFFGTYMARRLALEMMSPAIDPSGITDSDATMLIIANFIGSSTTPSISKLWSDNNTYEVSVIENGTAVTKHVLDLTPAELAAVDFRSQIVQVPGQMAVDLVKFNANGGNPLIQIPARDVGGYVTLSDRPGDTSYAAYGATNGTNLRYIEGIWEVSMGLTLSQVASTDAQIQEVPRFVPENNSNMFQGTGQAACISCHGGGMSSLNHGYSTLADLFDYNANTNNIGLSYNSANAAPSTQVVNTMKSLGSTAGNRQSTLTCNLAKFNVCNPDSTGADPTQAWNVAATWGEDGTLAQMGWNGPTAGQGLNSLGAAIGQATLVYQNLTNRVINDICPMGSLTPDVVSSISAMGKAADDVRVIVAQVASQPSCR